MSFFDFQYWRFSVFGDAFKSRDFSLNGPELNSRCYSARRFDADRRANPLRSLDSGGSNFRAE